MSNCIAKDKLSVFCVFISRVIVSHSYCKMKCERGSENWSDVVRHVFQIHSKCQCKNTSLNHNLVVCRDKTASVISVNLFAETEASLFRTLGLPACFDCRLNEPCNLWSLRLKGLELKAFKSMTAKTKTITGIAKILTCLVFMLQLTCKGCVLRMYMWHLWCHKSFCSAYPHLPMFHQTCI